MEAMLKWGFALALSAFALLAPVHGLLGAVAFLIAADLVTGLLAAHKRGDKLTSKALSRTIYKTVSYQLAVISGFALEGLVPGALPVAKLCAAAIGLVEAKSILENVHSLTGTNLRGVLSKLTDAGRAPPADKP